MFDILHSIKKLSESISDDANSFLDLPRFCVQVCDVLNGSVKLFSNQGEIYVQKSKLELVYPFYDTSYNFNILNSNFLDIYLNADENIFNLEEPCTRQICDIYGTCKIQTIFSSVIILKHFEKKLGGILISRCSKSFIPEEIYFCNFVGSILALEIIGTIKNEKITDSFLRKAAYLATNSLSYSELRGVNITLHSLKGNEGTVTLTSAAKQAYISISLLSTALKKIESTGVISSNSMGVKGKHIIVQNPYIKEYIKKALEDIKTDRISSLND